MIGVGQFGWQMQLTSAKIGRRPRPDGPFACGLGGYLAVVADLAVRRAKGLWRGIFSSPVLTLNGWVAFNLPRTVTALGGALLTGLVAVHVYVLSTQPGLPGYFAGYVVVLAAGCLAAAAAMLFAIKPAVPQAGWYFGSALCSAFLAVYLITRWLGPPGLGALTGRWDFAPGTLGMACAGAFIAVHTTVLSGINVAYPQRRQWHD